MSKIWIVVILLVIVGAGGYFIMRSNQMATPPEEKMLQTNQVKQVDPMDKMMEQTIQLVEQNTSGESGTATLTEKDGKVTVTLNMAGTLSEVPQPAHIHVGSCPDVGAVEYPLTNVVNGKSETTLDVTFSQLAAKQPLGINVHKSVPEMKSYVSCGDLNLPMSAPASSSSTTTTTTTIKTPATPPSKSQPGY